MESLVKRISELPIYNGSLVTVTNNLKSIAEKSLKMAKEQTIPSIFTKEDILILKELGNKP